MWNVARSIVVLTVASLAANIASRSTAAEKAARPPSPIEVTINPIKASPTLAEVNSGKFEVVVSIQNTSDEELIVWPRVAVQVLDAKGKPVPMEHNIGSGDRDSACALEDLSFVELRPRKAHSVKVRLNRYLHDSEIGTKGWQLPGPGEYQVVLRYRYNRADLKKRYGADCKAIDDPSKPWNRAIEINKKVTVKLTVKP